MKKGRNGSEPQVDSQSVGSVSLGDEEEKAMCIDPFGPKTRPIAYVLHVPRLTETARQHGYALAVHGSLQRDLDLIAVPWSEVASSPEDLIMALCQRVGGFMMPNEEAMEKPHGRKAWIIHLGAGLYIDLSIMPRQNDMVRLKKRRGNMPLIERPRPNGPVPNELHRRLGRVSDSAQSAGSAEKFKRAHELLVKLDRELLLVGDEDAIRLDIEIQSLLKRVCHIRWPNAEMSLQGSERTP